MSRARLVADCLALLGRPSGPVDVVAPRARRLAAALRASVQERVEQGGAATAIVVFLRWDASPAGRERLLREVTARGTGAARLVVIDHNQPRSLVRRLVGALSLAATGMRPSRARYPTARELVTFGFTVERLALSSGERVQLVVARRRESTSEVRAPRVGA